MDRRTTLKWTLAAGVATAASMPGSAGAAGSTAAASTPTGATSATRQVTTATGASGYGTDPNLMATYHSGQLWPLTLNAAQRRLAAILADLIIPADQHSPSASEVGVVDFIDEWVSEPYPAGRSDRPVVLDGLAWLDAEAARRYGRGFAELHSQEQHAICDEICCESGAAPNRREAAHFFAVYRNLTAGGFYSTAAGRKDLGYIGNVARASFEGPPAALIEKLGLS